MKKITDGIFPELLEIEIEKEPSVGAEDSQIILKGLYPEMRELTIEVDRNY